MVLVGARQRRGEYFFAVEHNGLFVVVFGLVLVQLAVGFDGLQVQQGSGGVVEDIF